MAITVVNHINIYVTIHMATLGIGRDQEKIIKIINKYVIYLFCGQNFQKTKNISQIKFSLYQKEKKYSVNNELLIGQYH